MKYKEIQSLYFIIFILFINIYQINGISLYLTFFLYSKYPGKSFSNTCSSFFILFEMIKGYIRKMINEISDPSIKGIVKNNKSVTAYIGCLTIPYKPLSITF